jgi:hypothetical protein
MPEHTTVSIHLHARGAIQVFLEREQFNCLNSVKLLSYAASALDRYEEEGVLLQPRILLCKSIYTFLESVPGSTAIQIGEAAYFDGIPKRILKECATLARDGWMIYVERRADGAGLAFGLFSSPIGPVALARLIHRAV